MQGIDPGQVGDIADIQHEHVSHAPSLVVQDHKAPAPVARHSEGMTATEGPLPLAGVGVVVVALEQAVAGPFATRGKESIELDLKQPRGQQVLHALADRADVFLQNLSPAAAERAGVTAKQLRQSRPGLIACDISGHGEGGPYTERKAYDLLIQSEAGVVSITGTPEQPAKAGISVADIAAGMYAYSGILTALYQRRDTGRGQAIEVSMLEALGEWMGYPYLYSRYGGADPPRAGSSHATIAPYGPVRTGTGETVVIGLQNEREWDAFCSQVLRRADLVTDSRFTGNAARVTHREELDALIAQSFAQRRYADILDDLDRSSCCCRR
jgi:itaconate CoA-transferase